MEFRSFEQFTRASSCCVHSSLRICKPAGFRTSSAPQKIRKSGAKVPERAKHRQATIPTFDQFAGFSRELSGLTCLKPRECKPAGFRTSYAPQKIRKSGAKIPESPKTDRQAGTFGATRSKLWKSKPAGLSKKTGRPFQHLMQFRAFFS